MPPIRLPLLVLLLALGVAGCAASVAERQASASALARQGGLLESRLRPAGGAFTLAAFHRITRPEAPVHVYIEGDGSAWETRTRLSRDPTPRNPEALRLAIADPAPNVVYLGRPCQFGGVRSDAGCDARYWSSHRFAPEVITATGAVLDSLLDRFGGQGIDLIGYSGGGAVAALLAARRGDVLSLRTVAAPLDHAEVTRHHGVSPMAGSLNPIAEAARLRDLPQIHFAGTEDTVVPSAIGRRFTAAIGACARLVEVPGQDHGPGWSARWIRLLTTPPSCH